MVKRHPHIVEILTATGLIAAPFVLPYLGFAPPTINLDDQARETPIDLAANAAVRRKIDVALSNSFGFGGTNASLVIGKVRD